MNSIKAQFRFYPAWSSNKMLKMYPFFCLLKAQNPNPLNLWSIHNQIYWSRKIKITWLKYASNHKYDTKKNYFPYPDNWKEFFSRFQCQFLTQNYSILSILNYSLSVLCNSQIFINLSIQDLQKILLYNNLWKLP